MLVLPRSWLSLSSASYFSMSAMVTLHTQRMGWPRRQPRGPGPPALAQPSGMEADGPGLFQPSQQSLSREPKALPVLGWVPGVLLASEAWHCGERTQRDSSKYSQLQTGDGV